jgi:hypothetical protein
MSFVVQADVAELADAHDSKSCGVAPRVGSTPTIGIENRRKALGTRGFTYVKSLVFYLPNTIREKKIVCVQSCSVR